MPDTALGFRFEVEDGTFYHHCVGGETGGWRATHHHDEYESVFGVG